MDEVKIPIGVGDYVLKQMLSRTSPSREIKVSSGGHKLFNGVIVKMLDYDENVGVSRAVIPQDLEHIGYILDDMEYELNTLLKEER